MDKKIDFFNMYLDHIKEIRKFLESNFGKGNYLKMKNSRKIPSRNYEIKNSIIKGYSFHGYGCTFQFKEKSIDVEFDSEIVGFKPWGLYLFMKKNRDFENITESEVRQFLDSLVNEKRICNSGKVFF